MDYLKRAHSLARLGLTNTSPNPHVGAVVVAPDGRVIGEGYHRKCGEAHAEVNAIASVAPEDRHLLDRSTIYVTLEPCSHYGKTPPCSKLIIDTHIPHVVVGVGDPNPKVNGRGINMLREAGVDVELAGGIRYVMCKNADPKFMSRFINHRPYITLKWAQSADGYMAQGDGCPVALSTPLTSTLVHKLRAEHDVILTSAATVAADNPRMDSRLWKAGENPVKVIVDRSGKMPSDAVILKEGETIVLNCDISEAVDEIYARGYNSILVEAGPALLSEFIRKGLYDAIRIETASGITLGENGAKKAPVLPKDVFRSKVREYDGNLIEFYLKKNNSGE